MTDDVTKLLPQGYLAVPFPGQMSSPIRLCLVISADEKPDRLVPLSAGAFTQSYLGCLIDADEQLQDWIVIELQSVPTDISPLVTDRMNNHSLDEAWQISSRGMNACRSYHIATPWEQHHPPPLAFNPQTKTLEYFCLEGAEPPSLCTDDAQLAAAGLPGYAGSRRRYLTVLRQDGRREFIPGDTDRDQSGPSIVELMRGSNLVPVNPACRLIRCRKAAPLDAGSLADVLGGAQWSGIKAGTHTVDIAQLSQILSDRTAEETSSSLFLGRHGRWGRTVESLHLKIKMLSDMACSVRTMLATSRRPMLNLSLASFAVHFSPPTVGLPFLWTAMVGLVDGGIAVPMELGSGDSQLFLPAVRLPNSIYQPQRVGQGRISGEAEFRLRSVDASSTNGTMVDATIAKAEVGLHEGAAVSIRLPLSGREIMLHGSVSPGAGPQDWRFRGGPGCQDDDVASVLQASAGVVFTRVWLDVWENHDAAYDMYALAVCFCRVLLGGSTNTLPAIIDDLHALAHAVVSDKQQQGDNLLRLITEDPRFKQSFGIENLFLDPLLRESAAEMIPMEIWRKTLNMLLRMLPGVMPDAYVRRYGIIKGRGQSVCFDALCDTLTGLLVQTRSLILIDWRMNREIHAVIRRVAAGI